MRVARGQHRPAGFTLIELVISSALMTIILAAGYLCLSAGVASEKLVNSRSEAAQSARVALNLMTADLRNAVPLWREFEFAGLRRQISGVDADNIDFGTRNYSPEIPGEIDFCEVSYYLEKDRDSNAFILYRRRDASPDPEPLAGGTREEIARGVQGLRLEYFDGWDWYDEWGDPEGKQQFSAFPEPNVSGLPEAVRITLSFDPEYNSAAAREGTTNGPPMAFQAVARLNMALFFYEQSGSSGTENTGEGEPSGEDPTGGPR